VKPNRWNSIAWDVVIALALAVVTTLAAWRAAPLGFNEGFVDMAHDGYQLREVLDLRHGGMVFRDTFEQYGPLGPYLNLAGFMAFGQRLLAMKYFVALWYGVTAMVLYALSRRLLGRPLAGFSILLWIALAPFYQHGVMISPHAYVIVLQAAAILILLKRPEPTAARLAAAGVLCGACWLLKQSMGTLFLLGVLSALLLTSDFDRRALRRTAVRAFPLVAAFGCVIVGALLWLAARGALHDWYLQTVQFPRTFYLAYYSGGTQSGPFSSLLLFANKLLGLQLTVDWYWIALRAIVVIGAGVVFICRRPERELAFIGMTAAWLWLAAFPSAAFMHQWWTLSLSFGALVYLVRLVISAAAARAGGVRGGLIDALTMAILTAAVSSAVFVRIVDARQRDVELSATITEPGVLRGVRTTQSTKQGFDRLNSAMTRFRAQHPHTLVATIDAGDGATHGIAESLPLLSWFDDNTHPFQVYWSLPVLSTLTYPGYAAQFEKFVRDERPLLVDAVPRGWSHRVSGYVPLAAMSTERGRLIVYAPEGAGASQGQAFAVDELRPPDVAPGRRRRLVAPITIDGRGLLARTYVSPDGPDTPLTITGPSTPLNMEQADYVGNELKREGGQLIVDGQASGQYTYLLKLKERLLKKGEYFFATGAVAEGGLSIGLLQDNQWKGYLDVPGPGPFLAVVMAPAAGNYSLVIANNLDRNFMDRVRLIGAGRALVEWWRKSLPNRFRINASGWIVPPPDAQPAG